MDDVVKLFGVFAAMGLAGTAIYASVMLVSVWAKRMEGRSGESTEAVRAELDELRARIEEGEQARTRITELEERLDFAERLLAQQREALRLPGEQARR